MRPLIAGNWKMHGLQAQLREIDAIAQSVQARPSGTDVAICVPATLIARAAQTANGRLNIGGQDCSTERSGAYTGDTSAEMLKDAGASVVIVGHSERRQHHGETDAIVAKKATAAARTGLSVILCIGESATQRKEGAHLSVCGAQIVGSVSSAALETGLAVAYEPLWAIGSGHVPTAAQIIEMHAHIRGCLIDCLGAAGAQVRILYGGSVKPANAREILALPEVGGALVGGASLKAVDFNAIADAATRKVPRHTLIDELAS